MTKSNPFRYFKTSPEIIRLAVMLYIRFPLSLRNVEDLLHERGIEISHETVRFWWNRFGPMFANEIRKRRIQGFPRSGMRRCCDEPKACARDFYLAGILPWVRNKSGLYANQSVSTMNPNCHMLDPHRIAVLANRAYASVAKFKGFLTMLIFRTVPFEIAVIRIVVRPIPDG